MRKKFLVLIAALCLVILLGCDNSDYKAAIALKDAGQYDEAIAAFQALDGYKDSAEQITAIKDLPVYIFSHVFVGDTVTFGTYEQDNDISNGKEPIEWRVLAKEGDKLLLISEYGFDVKPYNTKYTDVTWETCSLRKWLNEDFINTAFGAEEQALIQASTVSADKNPKYSTKPGNATKDKVFLLSITEANQYFSSNKDRKCALTDYAEAQGAGTFSSHKKGGKFTCEWRLRSPGYIQACAAYVYADGSVGYGGRPVDYSGACVRPALWINP